MSSSYFRHQASSESNMGPLGNADVSPLVKFEDDSQFESFATDLLFPLDIEEHNNSYPSNMVSGWNQSYPMTHDDKSQLAPYSTYDSVFEFDETGMSSDLAMFRPAPAMNNQVSFGTENFYYPTSYDPTNFGVSSPISIPAATVPQTPALSPCFSDTDAYPQDASFSPSTFAALHELPRSVSPTFSDETHPFKSLFAGRMDDYASMSGADQPTTEHWPQLLHQPTISGNGAPGTSSDASSPHSPHSHLPAIGMRSAHVRSRQRSDARRDSRHLGSVLASSSAPSASLRSRAPSHVRSMSHESTEDRDATIRRKKRLSAPEGTHSSRALDIPSDGIPMKSELKPPKLAPSAWQLYFTDWIQNYQATNPKKLNVAQAAKEAGQEYATLREEEKEIYRAKSQILKDRRERELQIYMKALSPGDIKRENMFRAAQRKSGKSRKSNIKDPNAPKKPLSAYFMFLARIRADPVMVQDVFGDETETTKQSVLAAAKWRDMTDDERKPFLARAEQEKLDYEAARRIYENVTGHGETSINFSTTPGGSSRSGPLMMTRTTSLQTDSAGSVDSDGDVGNHALNDFDYLDRLHRY